MINCSYLKYRFSVWVCSVHLNRKLIPSALKWLRGKFNIYILHVYKTAVYLLCYRWAGRRREQWEETVYKLNRMMSRWRTTRSTAAEKPVRRKTEYSSMWIHQSKRNMWNCLVCGRGHRGFHAVCKIHTDRNTLTTYLPFFWLVWHLQC